MTAITERWRVAVAPMALQVSALGGASLVGAAAARFQESPALTVALIGGACFAALVWTGRELWLLGVAGAYSVGAEAAPVAFYVCISAVVLAAFLSPARRAGVAVPMVGVGYGAAVALALLVSGTTIFHRGLGQGLTYLTWACIMVLFWIAMVRLMRQRGLSRVPWVLVAVAVVGGLEVLAETRGQGVSLSYEAHKHALKDVLGDSLNARAMPIMVGAPVAMALALSRPGRSAWIAGGCWAVAVAAVVMVFARASILGAVVGSTLVVVLLMHRSRVRSFVLFGLGAATLIALWPLLRLTLSDDGNVESRGRIWGYAVGLIGDRPGLGFGSGAWAETTAARALPVPPEGAGGAHNAFLETAFSAGAAALVLQIGVLLTFCALGVRACRVSRASHVRAAAAAGVGGVVALVTRGMFESNMVWGTRVEDMKGWVTILGLALLAMIVVASENAAAESQCGGRALGTQVRGRAEGQRRWTGRVS